MNFRTRLKAGSGLFTVIAFSALAAATFTPAAAQTQLTPTPEEFQNAASDTANWILPAKSYTANHYTPATQITPDNVGALQLAWKATLDDPGPMEVSPIVYNGTMYVTTAHDHVYALDAATGKIKWEFKNNPHVISFAANR
ncbi:MAG TPA: PQQ-binding-like beta-propeller repeat protein, partial [Gemmataceae bacterium]|nr:PQQ-binding-like beta-propeller repeat protein [Gemmataceae bacterium]